MTLRSILTSLMFSALLFAAFALSPGFARAEAPQTIVDKATATVENILGDDNYAFAREHLANAKGVVVISDMLKAGFFIGGEVGEGVVLSRGDDGTWSNPAFVLLAGGSIGYQIGVELRDLLIIILTAKGMDSVLSDQITMGGDVSLTAGTLGAGAKASTVGSLGVDMVSFSKSKGLYGGGVLEGAVIMTQPDSNAAYYGGPTTPKQILAERTATATGAEQLKAALAKW